MYLTPGTDLDLDDFFLVFWIDDLLSISAFVASFTALVNDFAALDFVVSLLGRPDLPLVRPSGFDIWSSCPNTHLECNSERVNLRCVGLGLSK